MRRWNPLLKLEEFSGRPSLAQFAKDGCWEQAWSFNRESIPTEVELLSYLEAADEVAFEVFFGRAFIGARSRYEPFDFVRSRLAAFDQATGAVDVFERIETVLSIGPLAQTFEFAEIGAVVE
jgi:hypothetical protein